MLEASSFEGSLFLRLKACLSISTGTGSRNEFLLFKIKEGYQNYLFL